MAEWTVEKVSGDKKRVGWVKLSPSDNLPEEGTVVNDQATASTPPPQLTSTEDIVKAIKGVNPARLRKMLP